MNKFDKDKLGREIDNEQEVNLVADVDDKAGQDQAFATEIDDKAGQSQGFVANNEQNGAIDNVQDEVVDNIQDETKDEELATPPKKRDDDEEEDDLTAASIMEGLKETILEQLDNKNVKDLKLMLHNLESVEILFVINSLSREQKVLVFRLLNKDSALFVFEQLETALQKELLESFTDEYTRMIIEELDPDDRASLFDELPAGVAKRLIGMLSPEQRAFTNMLMGYEPETAGRIMTPEFISLRSNMTVDDALKKVRLQAKDKETIYTLYVTDDAKMLFGVITLKELITSEPDELIGDIMNETIISVATDTDQEQAAQRLKELDLLALPVVDKENRIVGIITYDDAMDILEHEATEDIFNQAGFADITSDETNRSEVLVRGNLWAVWKVRLPFLAFTLVAGLVSGSIMSGFEDILDGIWMVALFVPLIMDMGGSVGNQSTVLFVRGVALGHIDTKKFIKHLTREVGIGFSIGLVAGVLAGTAAALVGNFWDPDVQMPMLGLAVGLALTLTATIASFLGFMVPFILVKLKLDQAAGSSPFITAIKDITGLTTYFLLVSLFLGRFLYNG